MQQTDLESDFSLKVMPKTIENAESEMESRLLKLGSQLLERKV